MAVWHACSEYQARRKAVPIEFGTEYGTLLEQQVRRMHINDTLK